jgi:hypothetical protein
MDLLVCVHVSVAGLQLAPLQRADSVSRVHATHRWLAASHTLLNRAQSEWVLQTSHRSLALHDGLSSPQASRRVPEHCTHTPE